MVQDMKRIAIIGGGASGLSAAIEASRAIELTGISVGVTVLSGIHGLVKAAAHREWAVQSDKYNSFPGCI